MGLSSFSGSFSRRVNSALWLCYLIPLMIQMQPAYAQYGVVYATRFSGGVTGGVSPGGFTETYCTDLQVQPFDVFEDFVADDTFNRSGTMTHDSSLSLGHIRMGFSGIFDNPDVNAHYGGGVDSPFCQSGMFPGRTQWNDQLTVTTAGTFRLTLELDSVLEASTIKPGGTLGTGVGDTDGIEARFHTDGGNALLVLEHIYRDGTGVRQDQLTQDLALAQGQVLDLAGTATVYLTFSAIQDLISWNLDSTVNFYIDPVTPGASYTTASGASYLSPQPRFGDVPFDYWAYDFIETLAVSGVTGGCGGGNYCPADLVNRAQMAVFLERGMKGSDYVPPDATGNVFLDVGAEVFAAAFIEQFFLDGITSGCGANNYCPNDPVTRGQMAVFLLRAKHGAAYQPPPATGVFGDVDLGNSFVGWIEQLATEGITSGCGGGNYCPSDPVTRAQMAIFLVRTFAL